LPRGSVSAVVDAKFSSRKREWERVRDRIAIFFGTYFSGSSTTRDEIEALRAFQNLNFENPEALKCEGRLKLPVKVVI